LKEALEKIQRQEKKEQKRIEKKKKRAQRKRNLISNEVAKSLTMQKSPYKTDEEDNLGSLDKDLHHTNDKQED
jgi:hypothetical protein